MSNKKAQINWDDDSFLDIGKCYARVRQLRTRLAQAETTIVTTCGDLTMAQVRLNKAMENNRGLYHRIELSEQLIDKRDADLAQARTELKNLRGANREYGRQLVGVTDNCEFWYREAQAVQAELDRTRQDAQDQNDGLKRRLAKITDEYDQLDDRVDDAMAQIGKYDKSLADNLIQYAVEDILVRLVEAEQTVHVHEHALGERDQALQAEHQLRREAEQHTEEMKCERDKWCMDWEDATAELLNVRGRLAATEQRAENAEAELSRGHGTLTLAGIPRDDESGKLSTCDRIMRLRQRAERTEALAQPVTSELAEILEALATAGDLTDHTHTADEARALAACIREALALGITE